MGFWDTIAGIAGGGIFSKKARKGAKNFLFGTPEEHERVSTLRSEQEPLFQQLTQAGMNPGAGGAFGTAADYYRDLLSNDSQTAQAMFAPEQRQFNEQIIPGLSEQFAGMGAGGLSSSGFRNAAVSAGTDLSERLGAIRAQLRQQGAQGLANIGQMGLNNFSQDVMTNPGSQGFLSQVAPAIGTAAGAYFGGPAGASIGSNIGNWFSNGPNFGGQAGTGNMVGKNTSPYGQKSQFKLPGRSF